MSSHWAPFGEPFFVRNALVPGGFRLLLSTDARAVPTVYRYGSQWLNTDSVRVGTTMPRRTAYTYDSHGRTIEVKDPANFTTKAQYDVLNRVTKSIGAVNDTTTMGYDALYLTSVVDAMGQVHGYTPNALGWTVSQTDPRNATMTYRYDRNGNLTGWTNRRAQTVSFSYDALNQPLSRNQAAEGVVTSYKSDPLGRFVAASSPISTDTVHFDNAGRVSRQTSNGYVLQSLYNSNNLRTELRMTAPYVRSTRYGYNKRMELDTIVDFSGRTTTFGRDAAGLPTTLSLPVPGGNISQSYSSIRRQTKIGYSGATIDQQLGQLYSQNTRGLISERFSTNQDTVRSFTYDAADRLTSYLDERIIASDPCGPEIIDPDTGAICNPGGTRSTIGSESYPYDKVGNRTDQGAVREAGNRLVQFKGYALTYDADGNLIRKLKSGYDQTLTWNSLGQLTRVVTNGAAVSYTYDGFGRRKAMFNPSRSHYYSAYDGDQVVFEGSDCCLEAEWTWYPGTDRPHSVRRYGDNNSAYYYARDELGSVTGLISTGGAVVNRYRYTPWGEYEPGTTETVYNPVRFAGSIYDAYPRLYFMRARYYDPELARFISEDPIGIDGGMNLYSYAGNNPVNFRDPYGLDHCTKWDKASGTAYQPDGTACELPGVVATGRKGGGGGTIYIGGSGRGGVGVQADARRREAPARRRCQNQAVYCREPSLHFGWFDDYGHRYRRRILPCWSRSGSQGRCARLGRRARRRQLRARRAHT